MSTVSSLLHRDMTPTQRAMFADGDTRTVMVDIRDDYIAKICGRSRRIAHVGCAASPNTAEKLARGTLLHAQILKRNSDAHVLGIDVDAGAIDLLEGALPNKAGYRCLDISKSTDGLTCLFDLVLLAEVIEHVPEPVQLVRAATELLAPGGELCVTVPNALSARASLRAVVGRELVHPDHFCYYSPKTIERTLAAAGVRTTTILSYMNLTKPTLPGRVLNFPLRGLNRCSGAPIGEGLIAWGVVASV